MTKAGLVAGALEAFLLLGVLAVAPAAGDPIDDCFDYANSSWSDDYLTCAGTGDGCSICVGSIVVHKWEAGGDAAPELGIELAALLPASSGMDGWLDLGESSALVRSEGELLRVERACSGERSLFDALDPRQRQAPVPARRSTAPALQPAPAP